MSRESAKDSVFKCLHKLMDNKSFEGFISEIMAWQGQHIHIGDLGSHLGHQPQKGTKGAPLPTACCVNKMGADGTPCLAILSHGGTATRGLEARASK